MVLGPAQSYYMEQSNWMPTNVWSISAIQCKVEEGALIFAMVKVRQESIITIQMRMSSPIEWAAENESRESASCFYIKMLDIKHVKNGS